jgi:acetylglutamate kinase
LVFYVNDAGLREKSGTLISSIQDVEFKQLYAKNNQPLIKATSVALDGRVNNIRIIDSRVEHSLALALLTEEVIGTSIFSEASDDEDDDNDLF